MDKDGNIASKSSAAGAWTYSYNFEDEMVAASFNGVTRETNVYDGLGNRVEAIGSSTAAFAYQGGNLIFERNLTSGVTSDNVYGDGMQLARVTGGTTYYYHEDRLGSTRSTTYVPEKVAVSFSSDYQPYGQSFGASGSEPFQFAGRLLDSATGLYYFNARFYDPSIARFTTKDSARPNVQDPPTFNSYAYARDNPLKYSDPTGLDWNIWDSIAVGLLIGLAIVATVPTLGASYFLAAGAIGAIAAGADEAAPVLDDFAVQNSGGGGIDIGGFWAGSGGSGEFIPAATPEEEGAINDYVGKMAEEYNAIYNGGPGRTSFDPGNAWALGTNQLDNFLGETEQTVDQNGVARTVGYLSDSPAYFDEVKVGVHPDALLSHELDVFATAQKNGFLTARFFSLFRSPLTGGYGVGNQKATARIVELGFTFKRYNFDWWDQLQ
jgi:RHS repeat-associated protein